ncbi:MAG TPA: hypothetical protein VLG16_00075 [Candidatus Saccharimonadales bacterium]|nr:hypothetical protein [Candidatus Saccharimonadales bacterium]
MDSQKQQVVERLKQANNILVTVRSNPSADLLAACIGVTLALNKMGKHATAVFSGAVPSTIEFLQPEKTLEKNTDSLQDFIIALDKSKADKLRYKVEDTMVKIFITPYRTSISQNDLQFSQGDFNVDVVLALGVHAQSDLDQAITAHGRILHDATVMSINTAAGGELGSINWIDAGASSLSELGVQLVDALDQQLIDGQIATSFLTGIVAETDRFSNEKTSPQTMSISAQLMSAGANQQLIATKLEEPAPAPVPARPIAETAAVAQKDAQEKSPEPPKPNNDGTIEIAHDAPSAQLTQPGTEKLGQGLKLPPVPPAPENSAIPPLPEAPEAPQIHIDEHGTLHPASVGDNVSSLNAPSSVVPTNPPTPPNPSDVLPPEQPLPAIVKEEGPRLMTEPPTFNTPPLTANAEPEEEDKATDSLSLPNVGLLSREPLPSQQELAPVANPVGPTVIAPTNDMPIPPVFGQPFMPVSPSSSVNPSFAPSPTAQAPMWTPPPTASSNPATSKTLSEIEQDVHSPHATQNSMLPPSPVQPGTGVPSNRSMPGLPPADNSTTSLAGSPIANASASQTTPDVADARDAVAQAINADPGSQPLDRLQSLNAMPLGGEVHDTNPEDHQAQVDVQPPAAQTFQPNMPNMAPPSSPPPMLPPLPPQQ